MTTIESIGQPVFYPLCEYAVTMQFGELIDEAVLRRITTFDSLLKAKPFPGFRQTVPAYTSLTVFYDPVVVIRQQDYTGLTCFDKVCNYLLKLGEDKYEMLEKSAQPVIIVPVCYGGEFGSDLEYVADLKGIRPDELISLHSEALYTVFMMGFIPGFAYLGGLNPLLHTPRKTTPRKVVPAGSVGIAGAQTGVYPLESPGGWQIIGRTQLKLFDASRPEPALLKAGAKVRFEPVSATEFNSYSAG